MTAPVLRLADIDAAPLEALLRARGLTVAWLAPQAAIPGSYWGDSEAGLVDDRLCVRADTPVHSALHEACHWLCMDASRRAGLHTDAGGDDLEECAVCYLQIVLADRLPGVGGRRLMRDMDAWGYSFRLGSAQAWFEQDAADARACLVERGLLPAACPGCLVAPA